MYQMTVTTHSKWLANCLRKVGIFRLRIDNRLLDEQERAAESMESFVWPQYLVEPQHMEGDGDDLLFDL